MNITYLYRQPGTGHSIEALFDSIQRETEQQTGVFAGRICVPNSSRGLGHVWKNLRFLWSQTAHVFHITGDVHYAVLALPASRTVLTIHDCSTLKNNQNRPVRYALFWLLWYYLPIRRASVVTAISEKTRQELLHYVGNVARKVVVVPNGYAPAFTYQPAAFRGGHPVLLQLGTAPNKNLTRLVAALTGIPCTLLLVGPLSDTLRDELRTHRITYRQYENLNQAGVIQLYLACDMVTFVSTYEGFGMPVLEANAVGRVVLTSVIPPLCDLFAGAAHFVEPTSISAIRAGILTLIHDADYRQSLIDAGRKNAQRYTVQRAAMAYNALYQQVAETYPTPEFA